ncbi:hypothetical protein CMI47_03805 [Candidatus Pacearchaeota archaeon]|nr:hypothetical protein [Candidatus Pacearchaeota archaeon]
MKTIKFILTRMNFLYSFIPLAKFLQNTGYDIKIITSMKLVANDRKPNSLSWKQNIEEAITICNKVNINYVINDLELFEIAANTDILFTIEGHGIQNSEKLDSYVIAIQNFNDFTIRIINKDSKHIYENIDAIWAYNENYKILAQKLGFSGDVFVDILPGYWHYKNKKQQALKKKYNLGTHTKIATCYLPRSTTVHQKETHLRDFEWNTGNPKHDLNHALSFAKRLTNEGYKIFLKQRSKNRNPELKHMQNYIEDIQAFPYTSMEMAFISDLSYGYMSAAVMDSAIFNMPYINFEKYEYPPETISLYTQHYSKNTIIGASIEIPIEKIVLPIKDKNNNRLRQNVNKAQRSLVEFIEKKC